MGSPAVDRFTYNATLSERDLEQYYSVEIPIYKHSIVYQFRIIENDPLSILIREESALLLRIKEGDKFKMRYYSNDPDSPWQDLYTELTSIERQSRGLYRGHYLATLEITEDQYDKILSWPYRWRDCHIIPFEMWSKNYLSGLHE